MKSKNINNKLIKNTHILVDMDSQPPDMLNVPSDALGIICNCLIDTYGYDVVALMCCNKQLYADIKKFMMDKKERTCVSPMNASLRYINWVLYVSPEGSTS